MFKWKNNKNLITFIILSVALIGLFAMLFCIVFVPSNQNAIICYDDEYRAILKDIYGAEKFVKGEGGSSIYEFKNGASIVTYQPIAVQIVDSNDNYKFYPHYKETVVIAIDRELTSESIHGFRDLFDSGNDISFFLGDSTALNVWGYEVAHKIYTSIAFGMYGEYDIKELAKELDKLEESGKFFVNKNKPFMIMTDREAVKLKKQGKDIEIVLPSEGTHTFVHGILTDKSIKLDTALLNAKLVNNGYMTMNDDMDTSYYPTIDKYSVSTEVIDISSYNNAVANAGKIIRRDVFDTKRFGFATNTDRAIVFVVLTALIVLYITTLKKRVKQSNIRIAIKFTSIAQIGLMASYILRMMGNSFALASTLLWYLYYVFFGSLSSTFLYIALNVGSYKINEKSDKLKKIAFNIFLVVMALCLSLVMTNDLHGQVLNIISTSAGIDNYTHMWGYYLTVVIIYAPVVFSIGLMIYKAQKSPKKIAIFYPLLAVVTLFIYGVLYVLEIPIGRDLDVAFATTLFSWLIMESCLRTGLVPINIGYNKLFAKSKLKMQIVINQGLIFNSYLGEIDRENTEEIRNRLTSGEFVYYKDILEINSVKKQIASTIHKLKKNNEELKKENEVKKELAKTIALEETYRQINNMIRKDKEIIATLLKEMEKSKSKTEYIARINILAIGIKRKSMLKIGSIAGQLIDVNILHSSIDEVRQFIKNTKLKFSSICRLTDEVPSNEKILIMYTIYLKMIDNALLYGAELVFVQMYEKTGDFILSFTADKQVLTDKEIKDFTDKTNLKIKQSKWEENIVVLLSIAKEVKA